MDEWDTIEGSTEELPEEGSRGSVDVCTEQFYSKECYQ